jgi:hypothetical protein
MIDVLVVVITEMADVVVVVLCGSVSMLSTCEVTNVIVVEEVFVLFE